MKKSFSVITLMVALGICFTACSQKQEAIITFQLTPSSHGVDDFLKLLGDYSTGYDQDTCYNVTPENISMDYGFSVFKFDASCSSFLLYENKIYPLGEYFGGLGTTSFAIADINADTKMELYFTYSWGSGLHRSQAGYFDTANHQLTSFDFKQENKDSVFVVEENMLCIYDAVCTVNSFVDISMSAEKKIASISMDSGNITFVPEDLEEEYKKK